MLSSTVTSPARPSRRTAGFSLVAAVLVSVSGLLAGCGDKKDESQQQDTPAVGFVTMAPESVTFTTDLPGRISSLRVADVRARVDGIILRRAFEEGSEVKAGQLLFKIDPAPYQAALDSAKATLARAEANQQSASLLAKRYKSLVAIHAVSQQNYDDALAAEQQNLADVASGKAAVETAQINLGYTDVISPISGRIGRAQVTEGAYVQQGSATLLATVQQIDPVYVDVTQSTTDLLRLRREFESGQLQKAGDNAAVVSLTLEDGREYSQKGKLEFSDITVDEGTGSITVRAVFPNPDRVLLPGMFVHGTLDEGVKDGALMVPQEGVTRDPKGNATVLLIDADNKIVQQSIKADRIVGDKWLVSDGLKAGDKVVVQGLQKVRPGEVVKPEEANLEGNTEGFGIQAK
ncbi:MAG: efflux RND transporter periplasmic adaptor subunit [Parvibaculaceae bacterium]|nr:efflux RND transporter periplasmic adaptor subunit [Parvibaculaceae bacterium]